jgi:L-arabinokinase
MYRIFSGSTHDLSDTAAFIEMLGRLPAYVPGAGRDFFSPDGEVIVTRAPGRLDLMGGIADYSGSLVLELPIASATHVALQRVRGAALKIISLTAGASEATRSFEMSLADLTNAGEPIEYASARQWFERQPHQHWAAYVAGAFLVLMSERREVFKEGARILISSEVPEGKGVSSSAALEVAVMRAVNAAYEIDLSPQDMALLCQRVENLVAGAPCGVMDQMTSACGEADRLLALVCQPAELKGTVKLPEELEVWGIDSGIRHSVGGADYVKVRTAAFMGYRLIADIAGLHWRETAREGVLKIDDERWRGYLANIKPVEFEQSFARHIPAEIHGGEFLERYKGITDSVTIVKAGLSYPVLTATRHPIYEHARVERFARILENWRGLDQAEELGELMFQSHASYSACGLGSAGTDELVRLVRERGTASGLYGAKITGGGSGGTVAVLARRGASDAVKAVSQEYARRTGLEPTLISGSSPGAGRFGHLKLKKEVNEYEWQS